LFFVPFLPNQTNIILILTFSLLTLIFFFLNSILGKSNRVISNNNTLVSDSSISFFLEITNIRVTLLSAALLLLYFSNFRVVAGFTLFNQLHVNSFNVFTTIFVLTFYFILIYFIYILYFYKQYVSLEYVYAITIYIYSSVYLYMSSTIYSFFFIIEVMGVSTLLLFSSISINSTSELNQSGNVDGTVVVTKPTKLASSLFIQFWISFFSSVALVLFLVLSLYMWNTSYFYEIDLLMQLFKDNTAKTHPVYVSIWCLLFIFSFFAKSGISPFHILKLDIYKGITLSTVYCYTILYFVSTYMYFIYIILCLVPSIIVYNYYLIVLILLGCSVYLGISLFSNKYLKVFLALSSVLNSLLLLLIALPIV
jgi:hypothetical protein